MVLNIDLNSNVIILIGPNPLTLKLTYHQWPLGVTQSLLSSCRVLSIPQIVDNNVHIYSHYIYIYTFQVACSVQGQRELLPPCKAPTRSLMYIYIYIYIFYNHEKFLLKPGNNLLHQAELPITTRAMFFQKIRYKILRTRLEVPETQRAVLMDK